MYFPLTFLCISLLATEERFCPWPRSFSRVCCLYKYDLTIVIACEQSRWRGAAAGRSSTAYDGRHWAMNLHNELDTKSLMLNEEKFLSNLSTVAKYRAWHIYICCHNSISKSYNMLWPVLNSCQIPTREDRECESHLVMQSASFIIIGVLHETALIVSGYLLASEERFCWRARSLRSSVCCLCEFDLTIVNAGKQSRWRGAAEGRSSTAYESKAEVCPNPVIAGYPSPFAHGGRQAATQHSTLCIVIFWMTRRGPADKGRR